MRQHQNADTFRNADKRSTDLVNVFPTDVVVIGNENNISTAKKFSVSRLPFLCAAAIACGRNTPRPKHIGLAFAFDNENRTITGNRLHQLRQPVRHNWDALDIPQPLARMLGIRAALSECFLTLSVFGENKPPSAFWYSTRSTTYTRSPL